MKNTVAYVAVIEVPDLSTEVASSSFISTMEYRLAALYSRAMSLSSQTDSSTRRRKRATTYYNATIQVMMLSNSVSDQ